MTYLLDTHVVLWWFGTERRIAPDVRRALADPDQHLLVSSVSAIEASTKLQVGKLDDAREVVEGWGEHVQRMGASDIAMTTTHGLLAGSLNWTHRDPFDRMLAAQALIGNLTLVTTDKAFRTLPGLKLLTW